ncbi:SH3 domain-containing protein [Clostridium perfringens]|uniref:SH3 domain-containing protein n=1 Tax=Clostridium perfringens TaxID=1502 RepID=UPI00396B3300|nr:SH3 domain-containing protein [Clostridium perfringens]MCX0395440.1 SH3 domain-containing protein [Clostridium perfringens]
MRKYPSINSVSIDGLSNETKVKILGKIGKWYKVKFHNKLGYIFEEFISIKK